MTIQHGLMQDCLAKLQDGAGPAPRDLGPVHEHTLCIYIYTYNYIYIYIIYIFMLLIGEKLLICIT